MIKYQRFISRGKLLLECILLAIEAKFKGKNAVKAKKHEHQLLHAKRRKREKMLLKFSARTQSVIATSLLFFALCHRQLQATPWIIPPPAQTPFTEVSHGLVNLFGLLAPEARITFLEQADAHFSQNPNSPESQLFYLSLLAESHRLAIEQKRSPWQLKKLIEERVPNRWSRIVNELPFTTGRAANLTGSFIGEAVYGVADVAVTVGQVALALSVMTSGAHPVGQLAVLVTADEASKAAGQVLAQTLRYDSQLNIQRPQLEFRRLRYNQLNHLVAIFSLHQFTAQLVEGLVGGDGLGANDKGRLEEKTDPLIQAQKYTVAESMHKVAVEFFRVALSVDSSKALELLWILNRELDSAVWRQFINSMLNDSLSPQVIENIENSPQGTLIAAAIAWFSRTSLWMLESLQTDPGLKEVSADWLAEHSAKVLPLPSATVILARASLGSTDLNQMLNESARSKRLSRSDLPKGFDWASCIKRVLPF